MSEVGEQQQVTVAAAAGYRGSRLPWQQQLLLPFLQLELLFVAPCWPDIYGACRRLQDQMIPDVDS